MSNKEELKQLKKDIGKKIYDKLTKKDRDWIIKTEGSIDFGHPVDFNRLQRDMERYKDGE